MKDRAENQEKLQRRIESYTVQAIGEPRDGKKLLVLDIDYTLFDHRSTAENPLELMVSSGPALSLATVVHVLSITHKAN